MLNPPEGNASAQLQTPQIEGLPATFEALIDYLVNPPEAIKLGRWSYFDQIVGGFRMKEFSILCGPTGAGKTTLLANISALLAERNVKHFVMSVETGRLDYLARVLSVWERKDLNMGDPIPREDLLQIFARHADKVSEDSIHFSLHETRIEVEQLKHEIKHAVEVLGCKIVFIDNLNYLMRITRAADAVVEMDRVIHDLIEFVKTVDVHIVMVMHPKKGDSKGGDRIASMWDIKGSSTAPQEAQNVFLFNRSQPDKDGKVEEPQDRELFIAKMRRRGMYVGRTICFRNDHSCYSEKGYR